jgi:hypothetical protein
MVKLGWQEHQSTRETLPESVRARQVHLSSLVGLLEALNKIREGSAMDYESPFIAVTTTVAVKGTRHGEVAFW